MAKQGVKGPSYKFIHGNTKEISKMSKESTSRPMDISHHIFLRIQPHIYSWIKQYGTNFLFWSGPQAQLLVSDPKIIKKILNNRDGAYPKTEPQAFLRKLVGDGIVTSEGEKWKRLRKVANRTFHGESLKSMVPEMIASAEIMLERWKHHEGEEIEVFNEFRLFTSEVISRTAFGRNYLQGKDMFDMLMKLAMLSSKHLFKIKLPGISKLLRSGDDIESAKLENGIKDCMLEMIKNREEVMAGEVDSFGNDFLGVLLKASHDAGANKRITEEEIIDECRTIYFAGQESTTSMLSWTIFLLAIHTDWQEEARKEVLKLFGQQNPISDGIARLKTMDMIIHESLRLYPPAPGILRKVEREVKMGTLVIPANLELAISTLALHSDPCIWGEDVLIFKPQRFSEGVARATKNNMAAYHPFGMGPRNCVGMNFATTEAKIALSMILQRYKFTLSPAYVHSPLLFLTVRPQHGVQIMLHTV